MLTTFIICVVAILVVIGTRNGLVQVGANPFLEPMPTSHVFSEHECLILLATFVICGNACHH